MMAAHLASEAALRLVKPGNDNIEVTETLNKVAESFECKVNYIIISCQANHCTPACGGNGVTPAGAE